MKNILLVAPSFFGYYKEIKKELENQGYNVDFYFDSSNNSNIFKALSRINKKIVRIPMYIYYKKEIEPTINKKNYDYVFFIFAMSCSFSEKMLKKIRENQKNAKFISYQWDGEKNLKFIKNMHQFFDERYTFDRIDSLTNSSYKFLPLFYINSYEKVGKIMNRKFLYDVSYIGTAHPQKLKFINEMATKLKKIYPKQFIFHYMPSKFKFLYHKLKAKEYRGYKYNDFQNVKLSIDEIIDVFENTKCILDAPQEGQNGLTIRTIECLGAKRKLITSNKDIKNYDFYNPRNIYVYDGTIDEENVFFKEDFENLSDELYQKYSLRNWLRTILDE